MIYGVVNLRREATLPLVVGNISKQQKVIDTVMALLYGYRLQVDNIEGGIVKIEEL
jgi:hypothetical protein